MKPTELLKHIPHNGFPVALGGCKSEGTSFDSCEYNVTVFDNKSAKDSIFDVNGNLVKLHHGLINETSSDILIQYLDMKILYDEQWDLKIFISNIRKNRNKIIKSFIKDCLVNAGICLTQIKIASNNSNIFASSWLKSAAYFLADAISMNNVQRPSPTHMLEYFRNFEKNKINETFLIIHEIIGIERATPSLLSRMCKSTIGFSDIVEGNGHSKIIQQKYEYLTKNSLFSNCYFYLGYINRNNFIKIKRNLSSHPESSHLLRIAFDIENDSSKVSQQSSKLHKITNDLISLIE